MVGKLSGVILEALFETVPIEFSVLDANDKILAWNKHDKRIFKRPINIIGRDVRNCHPNKSLAKVEQIISEMKEGTRDSARFWINLALSPDSKESKVLIEYFALRDRNGKYLGCLEVTRDITELQEIKGEKRLLD
jgi:hypothetical protein